MKQKFSFICMDEECMKDQDNGGCCIITIWAEKLPDYPNYCPWELDPKDHKYKPWNLIKK